MNFTCRHLSPHLSSTTLTNVHSSSPAVFQPPGLFNNRTYEAVRRYEEGSVCDFDRKALVKPEGVASTSAQYSIIYIYIYIYIMHVYVYMHICNMLAYLFVHVFVCLYTLCILVYSGMPMLLCMCHDIKQAYMMLCSAVREPDGHHMLSSASVVGAQFVEGTLRGAAETQLPTLFK